MTVKHEGEKVLAILLHSFNPKEPRTVSPVRKIILITLKVMWNE